MTKLKVGKTTVGLKTRKDGSVIVSSKSHVRAALEQIAQMRERYDYVENVIAKKCAFETKMLDEIDKEMAALKEAVEKFVLDGHDYEDDSVKITRVQGHRRTWNVTKLENIVPRGIFKNLIEMKVLPEKVDEYVRNGKLDAKKIAPAFEETPNKPYTKWTNKSDKTSSGEAEADELAAALG